MPEERNKDNPQGKIFLNERLVKVYVNNPEMINRESTLPCKAHVLFEDEIVAADPQIKGLIQDHLRVIVTPDSLKRLRPEQAAQLRELSSPYECGRVLEADEQVEIEGVSYVLTVKGVGCTSFFRRTGGSTPWHHVELSRETSKVLRKFPFSGYGGSLGKEEALLELKNFERFQERGIDAGKILAIYEIEAIPDKNGILRPVSYYQGKGIIPKDERPVLMFRALKSNFRLLDPVMFDMLDKGQSLKPFFEFIKKEYGRYLGIENPTMPDYLFWLAKKVVGQELPLIFEGWKISSGHWQDLARNISVMGEEVDLEDIELADFEGFIDFFSRVGISFGNLEAALRRFADCANQSSIEEIDFNSFGNIFWDEVEKVFLATDFGPIYERVMMGVDAKPSIEIFKRSILKVLRDYFLKTSLVGGNSQDTKNYQKAIVARIENSAAS